MATHFDPELKAYNQHLNGQGKKSLNGVGLNNLGLTQYSEYSDTQRHLEPILPPSGTDTKQFQKMSVPATHQTSQKVGIPVWQKLRLTQKATALAIALGTIPVVLTGVTAYYFANQAFTQQVSQTKIQSAVGMEDKVKRFMRERYGDVQVLAELSFLTNSNLRETTPLAQKQAALDRYLAAYKVYDSIAMFDLKGNVIVQSKGDPLP